MKIKHSKFKNTGILFELLVRQITVDTLKGTDSPAIDLMKEYFVKTELGREYKLYESIIKSNVLNEGRANMVITTILESSQNLNKSSLRRQKYNLIKSIKEHYDIDSFFSVKIKNYKELAALYTLIEGYDSKEVEANQIIDNKVTLLEHLTKQSIEVEDVKDDVLKEFQTYDKDLRILTYRVLLEKFNSKYTNLSSEQKQILKEFITSVDSAPNLKEFYNSKVTELKATLLGLSESVKDKATKVKIQEVSKLLAELNKSDKIHNDNLVDLLQYCELVKEVKAANGGV